jgi:hypothetical protein
MPVAAPVDLNFRIAPDAGYARISGPVNVPVQAGQTSIVPLLVLPKDGAFSGVVLAPDGSPLPGATVLLQGVSPHLRDLWLQTRSAEDGRFRIPAPAGRYRLGATIYQPDWIKPVEVEVGVAAGAESSGHILQFRLADVRLSGVLSVSQATASGEVQLFAWSRCGQCAGRFPVTLDANGYRAIPDWHHLATTWKLVAVLKPKTSSARSARSWRRR